MKAQNATYIIPYSEITITDIAKVGGKNASLGEMIKHLSAKGVRVPDGFVITSEAYWFFIKSNNLEEKIRSYLQDYDEGKMDLDSAGRAIRQLFKQSTIPEQLADEIRDEYAEFSKIYKTKYTNGAEYFADVAVRSSATAEDLPHASFAGQQETYLNISGVDRLLEACKNCFASLFTNRAISYREEMRFDHMKVALSVGVQKMVCADKSSSGVMFTVDTETGFPNAIIINGSWGLGENIVKGTVNPDQFCVFKKKLREVEYRPILERIRGSKEIKMVYSPNGGTGTQNIPTSLAERQSLVLNDDEVLELAEWGLIIEEHYGKAMDIEWVKDDKTDLLFIVQARPETVHSEDKKGLFKTYSLSEKPGRILIKGLSVGSSIVSGIVKIVHDTTDLSGIDSSTVLVTEMTEPDWVPALKNAAGIITNFGGRTCHAAIVSRELGIPAVVGTADGTRVLKDGQEVTLSSAEGDEGMVYEGKLKFTVDEIDLGEMPEPKTNVMLNLASPESAFKWWKMPVRGVGLARMEFIISNHIRVHPMALAHPERIEDEDEFRKMRKASAGYTDLKMFFVDKLAGGISKIAASQYPHPVIVRTSDFKTNEYAGLIGGEQFEPHEENPMLGWRGASRYYDDGYREGFELECRALKKVREEIGMDNVIVMIPFCRTIKEAQNVLNAMAAHGLKRGDNGLQVYMMCEIPSNYILAEKFAQYFDGFSIGSNDLTQLILGVDRDSGKMAHLFDESDLAVKTAIREVIQRAHRAGIKIGFCGQAPSDNTDYAKFLIQCGIDSISVVPDSAIDVIRKVAESEKALAQNVTATV